MQSSEPTPGKASTLRPALWVIGWLWVCGVVELLFALIFLWLGISRVSSDYPSIWFSPWFTLTGLLLLCIWGCFLRRKWAPIVATTCLVLMLSILFYLLRGSFGLTMLPLGFGTVQTSATFVKVPVVFGWQGADVGAIREAMVFMAMLVICAGQLVVSVSLWWLSRSWRWSGNFSIAVPLMIIGGLLTLDIATPRAGETIRRWRREAANAKQRRLKAEKESQAAEAVRRWLNALDRDDDLALGNADRHLRELVLIDSGAVVTKLRFTLKQAQGKRRTAIMHLLANEDFARRSSGSRSAEHAHRQVTEQVIRIVHNSSEPTAVRALAIAIVWNQNAGRSRAGRFQPVKDSHADFLIKVLSESLSSPKHPFEDRRIVCRLLGMMGPRAQRVIPSLELLAERDSTLRPDALAALEKIRDSAEGD